MEFIVLIESVIIVAGGIYFRSIYQDVKKALEHSKNVNNNLQTSYESTLTLERRDYEYLRNSRNRLSNEVDKILQELSSARTSIHERDAQIAILEGELNDATDVLIELLEEN